MKACAVCNFSMSEDMIFYKLSDLSESITSFIKLKINGESTQDNDSLCESCFNTILTNAIKKDDDVDADDATQDGFQEPYGRYITSVEESINNSTDPARCVWCRNEELSTLKLPAGPVREEIAAIIYPEQCPGCAITKPTLDNSLSFHTNREKFKEEISKKNNHMCKSCWTKIKNTFPKQQTEPETVTDQSKAPEQSIILTDYRRCRKSSKICFVIGCQNTERRVVPAYLKKVLLEYYKLYVPPSSRGCTEHIKEYYRDWNFLKDLAYYDVFNSDDVEEMLSILGGVKT